MGVDHVPLQDFTMDLVLTLMYMTTEDMEVQLPGVRRTAEPHSGVYLPIPIRFLPSYALTTLIITPQRTDRLD